MTAPRRILAAAWWAAPLCALALIFWIHHGTAQRVVQVSGLVPVEVGVEPSSPTGYTAGRRSLLLSERVLESMSWVAQTQEMVARGEWRVRHTDHENAPSGREVRTPSPYRWWLALCAALDRAIFGTHFGVAVERAALWADPALHVLLLVAGVALARWRGGRAAAVGVCFTAIVFPLAAAFLPGVPLDDSLGLLVSTLSVMLLWAANSSRTADVSSLRGAIWFAAAGCCAGIGLWISVPLQFPIIIGVVLGGIAAGRLWPAGGLAPDHWRLWAASGCGITLLAYVLEYAPAHLGSWNVVYVHPLHGIAWLGLGELAAQAQRTAKPVKRSVRWTRIVLGLIAVTPLPIVFWKTGGLQHFTGSMMVFRLTKQPDGVAASNLMAWLARDGAGLAFWATLLPVATAVIAGVALLWRGRRARWGGDVLLLLAALGVSVVLAVFQLRYWQLAGAVIVALSIPLSRWAAGSPRARVVLVGTLLLALVPAILLLRPTSPKSAPVLALSEVQGLLERDFAHWLSRRAPADLRPIVLAPPSIAATLAYYGGLSGLATFSPENKAGLAGAARIASATSGDEARALFENRQITHVVLPSWDTFLDDVVRQTPDVYDRSLINAMHRWALPAWLRPVPYQFPRIAGLEDYAVVVFEVVESQDEVLSLSRLAEYFVETGQLDLAASVATALKRFPADVGALVARAQVEYARQNATGLSEVLGLLDPRLARAGDRFLRWDRRVSLAIVLARQQRTDQARGQTERCLNEINVSRVRYLTAGSLYNLSILAHAFGVKVPDKAAAEEMRAQLPPELRAQL